MVFAAFYLSIASAIVASVGGLPGIIALFSFAANRPIFAYENNYQAIWKFPAKDIPCLIYIAGIMSNKGNVPFSPVGFELEIRLDGKWLAMDNASIAEGENMVVGEDDKTKMIVDNPAARDLRSYMGTVTRGQMVAGNLVFTSNKCTAEHVRDSVPVKARLSCKMATGEVQQVEFEMTTGTKFEAGSTFPLHGMKIREAKPSKK